MNPKKVYNYFVSNFKMQKSTRGWYRFEFPFGDHDDNSGAVNFNYLTVKDHRSGYCKHVTNFIMEVEDMTYREVINYIDNFNESQVVLYKETVKSVSTVKLPTGFKSFIMNDTKLAYRAKNYLQSRGFDPIKLDQRGFGYVFNNEVSEDETDFTGYIIVPFKSNGKLVYYLGRDFTGKEPKYLNARSENVGVGKSELLYNEDALNIYDEVFIVEGWACAETLGDNACATMGWNISRKQKAKIINSSCKRIIIVPDKGNLENSTLSFYQKALQIGLQFIDYKEVLVINTEEIQHPGKDVNDIGKARILEALEHTKKLSYSLALSEL